MSNHITFKKLTYRNILSVGAMPITLDLTKSPSTAILGANGQGKSVFLEALAFVLYGKPYRDVTKGKLVNNKNNKDLHVEVEFEIGQSTIIVQRGIKPDVFNILIDGKLADQNSSAKDYQAYLESNLLRMDFDTFKQLVLIGKTSYVPFMRLNAPKRRAFVESVLSLDVFAKMTALHKTQSAETLRLANDANADLQYLQGQVSATKTMIARIIEEAAKAAQDRSAEYKADMQRLIVRVEEQKAAIQDLTAKRAAINLESVKAMRDSADKEKTSSSQEIGKLQIRKADVDTRRAFIRDNDTCPTCSQQIDRGFKENYLMELDTQAENFEDTLQRRYKEYDRLQAELNEKDELIQQAARMDDLLSSLKQSNQSLLQNMADIAAKLNAPATATADTAKDEAKLKELEQAVATKREELNALQAEVEYNNMVAKLLKDSGIKAVIIEQFIPTINNTINLYLQKLGLFATFSINNQFEEEIKMRSFEPMQYNQLSEGEKLRFDMAVMLAWRDMARLKSNMSCNLLIMDEVFDSSLDQEGVTAFADLLKLLGGLNVFVITHTPEKLADSFRSFIRFQRVEGFTTLAPVSGF
nr:MAG TPA: STRUCTURAL MAINTENANCE OF CHROMOSOMES PROTEIN [Caudoviricetes sp.]